MWRSYKWFFLKNKKNQQKTNRAELIYKTCYKKKDKTYDFQKSKATKSFGREIDIDNLSLDDALNNLQTKKNSQERKTQLYFLKEGKKFLMFSKVEYFQKGNIQ